MTTIAENYLASSDEFLRKKAFATDEYGIYQNIPELVHIGDTPLGTIYEFEDGSRLFQDDCNGRPLSLRPSREVRK